MTDLRVRVAGAWVNVDDLIDGDLSSESQAAVALAAVDGETLTGEVQSNWDDNGYFGRNGFTYAANWTGPKPGGGSFAGFDDPHFIPVAIWAADFTQDATGYDRLDDVGVNGMFPVGTSDPTVFDWAVTRGKWITVHGPDHPTIPSDEDSAVVGVIGGEEPATDAAFDAITAELNTWMGGADGAGRFRQTNFADHIMNSGFDGAETTMPDEMVLQGDYTCCDQYWFAGSPETSDKSRSKLYWRLYYNMAPDAATSEETARGCHYGSQLDSIRKQYPVGETTPIGIWIEAAAPYDNADSLAMEPDQLRWSVWATLVHGARGIHYFVHNFRPDEADPGAYTAPPWGDYYGGPGVAGTGIYAAMKEVNTRAVALAPVINSPFDGYFVYGDTESSGLIEDAGFLTAVTSTNARSKFAGVDASCKWYATEGKHYIFSTTREEDGTTNWPVTFRMVDQGQTTAVEIHESNSISIDRGGAIPEGFCEFSDTFATAATYKTYRID